jgi:hypothetical protein
MKLTKDRFSAWECKDDKDYEPKYDDELIINIKKGESSRDMADYILECQEKAEKWDMANTDISQDDVDMPKGDES